MERDEFHQELARFEEKVLGYLELDKRVRSMETQLTSFLSAHQVSSLNMEKRDQDLRDLISRHDKILVGTNGTPGLKSDVSQLQKSVGEYEDFKKWVARWFLGALGVALMEGLFIAAMYARYAVRFTQ